MGSTLLIVETIVAGLLLGAIWSHTSVAGSEPNRQLARNALVFENVFRRSETVAFSAGKYPKRSAPSIAPELCKSVRKVSAYVPEFLFKDINKFPNNIGAAMSLACGEATQAF